MNKLQAISLITAVLTTGCIKKTELICDPGFVEMDGACVPVSEDTGVDVPDAGDGGADMDAFVSACDPACMAPTEHCDEDGVFGTAGECVACLETSDCDVAGGERCEGGACVQCLSDSDCDSATAPVCGDDGQCVPCTVGENDGCDGVMDGGVALGVCADVGGVNECVVCASGSEEACGDEEVCDLRAGVDTQHTCVGGRPSAFGTCNECINNSECPAEQVCVETRFGDPAMGEVDTGYRCQWAVPADEVDAMAFCTTGETRLPFVGVRAMSSTAGGEDTVTCALRRTSCQGWLHYQGGGRAGALCSEDSQCGEEGLDDALCNMSGTRWCTMRCGNAVDCVDRTGRSYVCSGAGLCTFTEVM